MALNANHKRFFSDKGVFSIVTSAPVTSYDIKIIVTTFISYDVDRFVRYFHSINLCLQENFINMLCKRLLYDTASQDRIVQIKNRGLSWCHRHLGFIKYYLCPVIFIRQQLRIGLFVLQPDLYFYPVRSVHLINCNKIEDSDD